MILKKVIFILILALFIYSCGTNHKLITNDSNPDDTTSIHHSPFENMRFGDSETLELMTWNLREFPIAGNTTVEKVAEALKYLTVDVVAMEEIKSNSQFNNLIQKLNTIDSLNSWVGYRSTGAYAEINIAYVYNTNFVQKDTIYQIFKHNSYAFPRSPLVFEFHFKNKKFISIANHYKAKGDEESVNRRKEASIELDDYIRSHFGNDNLILLGDLNDELTDPPQANVFQIFLDDPNFYKFVDMEIAVGPSSNWSYPQWPSHIDHIMITFPLFDEFNNPSSEVKTIKPDNYIGSSSYYSTISDHRPVALKLEVD